MNNNEETDSSAQDLENNHPENLDLSLSLSINQSESSENQITSTFTSPQTEVNVGVTSSRAQQGMNDDVLSGNTTSPLIPSKRRYSDVDLNREFFEGESSAQGARARQTLASSQGNNTNINNLIASQYYRNQVPNSGHFQSEAPFLNARPLFYNNMQNPLGEVQRSVTSNFNLYAPAPATATATTTRRVLFSRPTTRRLPNIHNGWWIQMPLNNTPISMFQGNRAAFIVSTPGAANGSTSSVRPVQNSPNFINSVGNVRPIGQSTISVARPQFLNQRGIQDNVLRINPGTGLGNQDNGQGIMGRPIGTSYQFGSYNNNNTISSSNAQGRVTAGSTHQMFSNNPGTQQNSQEQDLSLGFGFSVTDSAEGSTVERFDTQNYYNTSTFMTRMFQANNQRVNRRTGYWDEELRALASLILDSSQYDHGNPQVAGNMEEMMLRYVENQQENYEEHMGLPEERILQYINCETIEFFSEDIPDEIKEKCVICQAIYTSGEEVGRLDCIHRFHVDCIRQWLMIRNTCPVCMQTGLAAAEDGNDE